VTRTNMCRVLVGRNPKKFVLPPRQKLTKSTRNSLMSKLVKMRRKVKIGQRARGRMIVPVARVDDAVAGVVGDLARRLKVANKQREANAPPERSERIKRSAKTAQNVVHATSAVAADARPVGEPSVMIAVVLLDRSKTLDHPTTNLTIWTISDRTIPTLRKTSVTMKVTRAKRLALAAAHVRPPATAAFPLGMRQSA